MGRVERTDQERWAWCFARSADVKLYNFERREMTVSWWSPRLREQSACRSVKSKCKTQEMWRRCVDELMDKETT